MVGAVIGSEDRNEVKNLIDPIKLFTKKLYTSINYSNSMYILYLPIT